MKSDKFRNRYRIPSARMPNWDYRWQAIYFVTICTKNGRHYFGEVVNKIMNLSEIGQIAYNNWVDIPNHCQYVELINFVVMPNHLHGLVYINGDGIFPSDFETLHAKSAQKGDAASIQEDDEMSLFGDVGKLLKSHDIENKKQKNEFMAKISPKYGSLSTAMRSYKSSITNHANKNGIDFGWHTRFHDHIVRNDFEFNSIYNYIDKNPEKWDSDRYKDSKLK